MIRINLAPAGTRPRMAFRLALPSFNLGVLFLLVYALAAGGLGWYWWSLAGEEKRLAADVDRASKELATLRTVIGQSAQVKARVAELRQRVQTVAELTKGQGRPMQLFDMFADALPPDLWITGLEEKARVLKVTGAAFSTTAVSDFLASLRRSGKFKDVDIILARQDLAKTPRLVTFEVTCRFEG
ncbi:MAG: PilN domain-containing protein [Candidatus Rokubacteria bacterium]|nr:PilN domain-containing protein [Candidatus Rokubacteria bacterium]MBI4593595.1 PilN domain-containing protein [Candidatus Rokubacteria bacterium]